MSKTSKSIVIPKFPGRALVAAQAAYDKGAEKLSGKFSDTTRVLFNAWIDSVRASGLSKDEAGCAKLRDAIVDQEDIADALRNKLWTRTTIGNYAQGAMRAFFHGSEWSPRAFQAVDKGGLPQLPWSKSKSTKPDTRKPRPHVDTAAAPADKIGAPASEVEARAFIAGQLRTLVSYGNKHMKTLDLKTRDVLAQLDKLAATVAAIDKAPV